jgi:hypothetical protein
MSNQVITKLRAKGVSDEAIVDYMHFRELFPDGKFERKDAMSHLGCSRSNICRRADALVSAGFATVERVKIEDLSSVTKYRISNVYTLKGLSRFSS